MTAIYAIDDQDLLDKCQKQFLAARGPGGQHANRNATGIRLQLTLAGGESVSVVTDGHRERRRNQQAALRQIRLQMACRVRGVADPAWLQGHRRGRRLQLGATASDLHLVIAVLLDALDQAEGALALAATNLDLSSSQLVRALAVDKHAWQTAQDLRQRYGLSCLHRP
jgi:hypothetical protein